MFNHLWSHALFAFVAIRLYLCLRFQKRPAILPMKSPNRGHREGRAHCPDCNRQGQGIETMIQDLIKEGANVCVSMSASDLKAFGLSLLSEYAAQEARKKEEAAASEEYLKGGQVCEMLGVTRSTLWRWAKEGYLMPSTFRGRSRYRKSDITKLMEERA